jgi:lipopolysaccharide transport system ATP-binding protein
MSNYAIRIENIGKKYQIRTSWGKNRSLRDSIQESFTATIQTLGGRVGRAHQPGKKASPNQTFWALQDVTFDVQVGDSIGIIGSNGAGKSTLLKIISRITSPTTGKLRLRGRVGSLLEVGTGFHADLTGRENVYLNGAILGMRRREINRKFDEIVAFSEVEEFMDTQVKFYSTGMKMRLAFSVAAHLDPEIMLVDEVLAVGDIAFQRKSLNKMSNVISDGRTVLFVSHNIGAVRALCQKAVYLEKGRILSIGNVEDVAQAYLNSKDMTISEHILSEIDAKKDIQILSAMVLDRDRQPSVSIPHDQPFFIRLKLVIHKQVTQTYLSLKIYNQELETILVTHDFEKNEDNLLTRNPGNYTVEIKISAPLLPPGQYLLGLVITNVRRKREALLQKVDDTVPFEIYDNGSSMAKSNIPWSGFAHIPMDWEYLKINHNR